MKHVCMLIDGHIIEVGEDMKMDASVEDLTKLLNI